MTKRFLLLLTIALLAAAPAFAAGPFELEGWASWVNSNSSTSFDSNAPNQPFGVSLHNKNGWGVGANIFWSDNVSTDFSAVQIRPETRFVNTASGATISGPNLRMTPITGIIQFHFIPKGFVDPYVGGGVSYVLFDNVSGPGSIGVNKIDFKHDVGFAANAGVQFALGHNFALIADGKYVPFHASATADYVQGGTTIAKFKINPAIFSAGAAFRF